MTLGEQLYLGLVFLAFFTFGITLAVVSSQTSRHLRRLAREQAAEAHQPPFNKAA